MLVEYIEKMSMQDQIEECVEAMIAYKKNLGDQLKPITIKKYKGDLKTICKMMGDINPIDSMDTLKDHENVIHTLHTKPYRGDKKYNKESLKSKIGFMSMLMEAYDHQDSHKGYYGVYNDIKGELFNEDKEGTSDKRVKATDNELTKEDIEGCLRKYRDTGKFNEHMKYLGVCCMSKIPARRCEYGNTKFIQTIDEIEDTDANYLWMDHDSKLQFILQEYKTAGRYGTKYIDVPDGLSQDILDSYIKYPRDYLFPKTSRDKKMLEAPMGSNGFAKLMARTFTDKKVGVNSFRKFSKNHGVFDMGADALAKEMGHSTATAERSYTKV